MRLPRISHSSERENESISNCCWRRGKCKSWLNRSDYLEYVCVCVCVRWNLILSSDARSYPQTLDRFSLSLSLSPLSADYRSVMISCYTRRENDARKSEIPPEKTILVAHICNLNHGDYGRKCLLMLKILPLSSLMCAPFSGFKDGSESSSQVSSFSIRSML
jgi:hypothetical protein